MRECVRACARARGGCVSQRESRTGNQRTHTRALGLHRLWITPDELLATVKSPESRHTDAESCAVFFSSVVVAAVTRRALPRGGFAGRNRIVASPAETPLIRRGKRGHEELKASLFFCPPPPPTHLLYSPDSPFSSGRGCGGGFRIPLTFFPPCEKFITRLGDETAENVHAEV